MLSLSLELQKEVAYYDKSDNVLFINVTEESNLADIIKDVTEDILCQYIIIESIESKECSDYRENLFSDGTKILYDGKIIWTYR